MNFVLRSVLSQQQKKIFLQTFLAASLARCRCWQNTVTVKQKYIHNKNSHQSNVVITAYHTYKRGNQTLEHPAPLTPNSFLMIQINVTAS